MAVVRWWCTSTVLHSCQFQAWRYILDIAPRVLHVVKGVCRWILVLATPSSAHKGQCPEIKARRCNRHSWSSSDSAEGFRGQGGREENMDRSSGDSSMAVGQTAGADLTGESSPNRDLRSCLPTLPRKIGFQPWRAKDDASHGIQRTLDSHRREGVEAIAIGTVSDAGHRRQEGSPVSWQEPPQGPSSIRPSSTRVSAYLGQ